MLNVTVCLYLPAICFEIQNCRRLLLLSCELLTVCSLPHSMTKHNGATLTVKTCVILIYNGYPQIPTGQQFLLWWFGGDYNISVIKIFRKFPQSYSVILGSSKKQKNKNLEASSSLTPCKLVPSFWFQNRSYYLICKLLVAQKCTTEHTAVVQWFSQLDDHYYFQLERCHHWISFWFSDSSPDTFSYWSSGSGETSWTS